MSSRTGSPLPSNGGERRGWAGPAAGPSSPPRLSPGPEYRAREGVDRTRPVSGHMLDDMRRNGSSDSLRTRGGGSGLGLPPINTSHLHPSTSSSGVPYGHQGAGGSNSSSPATSPRLPPAEYLSQHYPSPHHHPTGASSSSSHNSLSHNSGLSHKPHWYPSPAPSPTNRSPALGSSSSHPDRSNSGDSSSSQPGGEQRVSEKASGRSGSSRDGGALVPQACASCHLPMTGQFVRALGTVFHLDCFRCQVSPMRGRLGGRVLMSVE